MIDLVGALQDVAGLVSDPMRIFTLGDDQVDRGAIYNDGNDMTRRILGSRIEGNRAERVAAPPSSSVTTAPANW